MRKNTLRALYTVLIGLTIYSCSELTLPDQIGLKGTLSLPIRIGAINLNETLRERMKEAFPPDANEGGQKNITDSITIYNVNYPGQTVQTFCIYLPIEMTEDLNPNSFLKKIDEQIIKDMSTASTPIEFPGLAGMPVAGIDKFDIPPIKFTEIAQYVESISFNACNGNDASEGIGLIFYFDEIPPGLKMTIKCEELNIPATTKSLEKGKNIIFGNNADVSLKLEKYKYGDDVKLNFTMTLQSEDGSGNWNPDGYSYGTPFDVKGKMYFFREWTEASINMEAAINTFAKFKEDVGKFPKEAFDLSRLGTYLNGGFIFSKKLRVNIYMDCPTPDLINQLLPKLVLKAHYTNGPSDGEELYSGKLFVRPQPLNIDRYLNKKDGSYNSPYLPPGDTSEHNDEINMDVIKNIFQETPDNLYFLFNIDVKEDGGELKPLIIRRSEIENADTASVIRAVMMIMLPMSLEATGDGVNKSSISLPNMFGEKDDLFGRKEESKELFGNGNIDYIRLTIDFANPIFTDGYLSISKDGDGKDVLFPPDGIPLNGKKTVLNFTKKQFDIIENTYPIAPDIKIEINNGGMIEIPKDMAIMSIKFEMKGLVSVGDF